MAAPCHLSLCIFVGAPPSAENTPSSSFFSGFHQATDSISSSQGLYVCDLLSFHCSELYDAALYSHWGCADCLCLMSWWQFWCCLFSSLTSSWAPGGDRLCLSVIMEEPGMTVAYKYLLIECSNPSLIDPKWVVVFFLIKRKILIFFILAPLWDMWNFPSSPGIEPLSPALKAWSLSHWTPREVLGINA